MQVTLYSNAPESNFANYSGEIGGKGIWFCYEITRVFGLPGCPSRLEFDLSRTPFPGGVEAWIGTVEDPDFYERTCIRFEIGDRKYNTEIETETYGVLKEALGERFYFLLTNFG